MKAGGFIQKCALLCKESPFKLTANSYIQHYCNAAIFGYRIKKSLSVFLAISLFRRITNPDIMNLDDERAKQGRVQYKGHRSVLFNLNSGEPKGRDVSEGLIGSDTIGKLSRAAPCIVFYHLQRV